MVLGNIKKWQIVLALRNSQYNFGNGGHLFAEGNDVIQERSPVGDVQKLEWFAVQPSALIAASQGGHEFSLRWL